MSTARQKVFNYIQKRRSVSAQEIARDLGMTQANARHHLSLLMKDGRIEVVEKRGAGAKGGRPIKIYGISRNLLGDGLPALTHHLLEEMLGHINAEEKLGALKRLGQRLAGLDKSVPPASPMLRLTATVKKLNELGYHARWEAHASGPRIILSHCPYAAIIAQHPELCKMDAALLEELLGEQVEQVEKGARGGCVFGVR